MIKFLKKISTYVLRVIPSKYARYFILICCLFYLFYNFFVERVGLEMFV